MIVPSSRTSERSRRDSLSSTNRGRSRAKSGLGFIEGYRGEKVADVTAHPVLRHAVDHASLDYAMAEDPDLRKLAVTDQGYSRYFHVPRSSDDLLARSAMIEAATRSGKTLVVLIKEIGTDALGEGHRSQGRGVGGGWD